MKKHMIILMLLMLMLSVFSTVIAQDGPSVGLANPWVETDPDGLMQTLGMEFEVPEGAEDVIYRMNESEKLAEMRFTLNGMPFTARIKPADTELEDISGMYFNWQYEEFAESKFTRRWYQEKHMKGFDGENTVEVFLWFDIVPGLMYSLSVEAPDLDGFDIIAVAEMVCHQTQGDA